MNTTTKNMIKKYELMKLKYDFMGYMFLRQNQLSFHHLIVPHKDCKMLQLAHGGYLEWNGAILTDASHEYLHIIGNHDYEIFERITEEMIDQNIKGHLDMYNIMRINDALEYFEERYKDEKNKKGYPIIKEEYTKRLMKR